MKKPKNFRVVTTTLLTETFDVIAIDEDSAEFMVNQGGVEPTSSRNDGRGIVSTDCLGEPEDTRDDDGD